MYDRNRNVPGRSFSLTYMLALLSLIAVPVAAQWPTYHGQSNLAGSSDTNLPAKLEKLWTARAGGSVLFTPVAGDRRIYCAIEGGVIQAFDLDGKPIWSTTITDRNNEGHDEPVPFSSPLLFVEGLVLGGTDDGWLRAFDAGTGRQKWVYKECSGILGTPNYFSPEGSSKTFAMVIDQAEGKVHAVDPANGKAVWVSAGTTRCDGSGGAARERIVFGGCNSVLHVLSPTTGKSIGEVEVGEGNEMAGGTVIAGDTALAGSRSGSLICVDLKNMKILWTLDCDGGELFTTVAVKGNKVIVATGGDKILCVDRNSGRTVWSSDVDGAVSTSPVIVGDKVIYTDEEAIHMLSLKNGSGLWSGAIGAEPTSPAVIGNALVVGTSDGRLVAFGKKE